MPSPPPYNERPRRAHPATRVKKVFDGLNQGDTQKQDLIYDSEEEEIDEYLDGIESEAGEFDDDYHQPNESDSDFEQEVTAFSADVFAIAHAEELEAEKKKREHAARQKAAHDAKQKEQEDKDRSLQYARANREKKEQSAYALRQQEYQAKLLRYAKTAARRQARERQIEIHTTHCIILLSALLMHNGVLNDYRVRACVQQLLPGKLSTFTETTPNVPNGGVVERQFVRNLMSWMEKIFGAFSPLAQLPQTTEECMERPLKTHDSRVEALVMAISAQSLDRDQWVSVFVVICRLAGLKTRLVQSFTHLTPVKVPKSVNQAIDRAFSGDVEGQAETSSGKRRRMHTQEIQDSHADTYTHTQADTNTHTDTQTQTNTQTQSGRERGMHGTVDDAHGTTTPPDGQAQANGSGKQRMVVSLADTTRLNARTQLRLKGKWNKDLLGNEGEGSSSCSNAQTDTNTDTYTHTHIDTTDAAHADRDRHTRTRTETNAMTIGTDINSDSARAGDIDRTSGIDSRWVSTRSSMRTGRSAQRSSAQASRSATKSDTDLPSIDTWVEVYVRNSNARNKRLWTTVNPIVLNIEPIPTSRLHQPVVYVLGVDESGEVKDVTERYAEKWLTETQRLRLPESLWSGYVLGPYLPKNARADQEENAVMALGHQKKGWPTIAGFRSHPLYALERHCNKRQVIYPKDDSFLPALGYVRGEIVYRRTQVHTLRDRLAWNKRGKDIQPNAIAVRVETKKLRSGEGSRDVELFGEWQTRAFVRPKLDANGRIPCNQYGNVDLYHPSMLPEGTRHVALPGSAVIAKKLGFHIRVAMTGFEYKAQSMTPKYGGVVILSENAGVLNDAWIQQRMEKERLAESKREQTVLNKWRRMSRFLLIRDRLRKGQVVRDAAQEKFTAKFAVSLSDSDSN